MSDKLGILDIKAILNNNIQCNIEMQIIDNRDIENRLLFYWSKLYSKTISKGMGYKDAKRTIVILFADYMLDNLKKIKNILLNGIYVKMITRTLYWQRILKFI